MRMAKGPLAPSPSQRSLGMNQEAAYMKCTAANPPGTTTSVSFPDVMPCSITYLGPAAQDGDVREETVLF